MPLYVMLGEDGNGETEIFCTFIVSNEEKLTIQKMVQIFKDQNPSWTKTKTVITDKDFVERKVFIKTSSLMSIWLYAFSFPKDLSEGK